MRVTPFSRLIGALHDSAEEAWQADHRDAMDCLQAESLVSLALKIWEATKTFAAHHPPAGRNDVRELASLYRTHEMTFGLIRRLAARSAANGYAVDRLDLLEAAHGEVRGELLMPTARLMAARDPQGRTAEQLRVLMLPQVEFRDGRPVIGPELAAVLPCPFDPEPAL
ncbi:MAG: hypothetical protein AVDCRST_MAG64-3064 [uncultured Phycisphaerae bacterium]|uniref:Uncharacterized protein n=1 Tax=uncultured Phycisphaerae bacterium TaxID=904963 RepID=A0A6J4PK77_9BACT|nr:MAG: hypothetical protein AVDCRST_MAG64-3064 [uncultured Phycisphaerae bacterium]